MQIGSVNPSLGLFIVREVLVYVPLLLFVVYLCLAANDNFGGVALCYYSLFGKKNLGITLSLN
jgi:hypothetical protein